MKYLFEKFKQEMKTNSLLLMSSRGSKENSSVMEKSKGITTDTFFPAEMKNIWNFFVRA